MKILVDENIPSITVNALRTAGHEVLDIRGTPRQGIFDDELWSLAQTEGRMLVTEPAQRETNRLAKGTFLEYYST